MVEERLSCEAAFLLALAEHGVTPDIGEVLIQGDGRYCGPGALAKGIAAYDRARARTVPKGSVEKVVEAMRDDPFADDIGLMGTTQQDSRMAHYAQATLAALGLTEEG